MLLVCCELGATLAPCGLRGKMLASMAMSTKQASLAALLLAALSSSCATYKIAIEPPAMRADARVETDRPPLLVSVESTYAPYQDGELLTADLYPRDREHKSDEEDRYCRAFVATQQFASVHVGAPGSGLHCALSIVSGREAPDEWRRALSILLTFGQLSHEQREIVRVTAIVSLPGRVPSTYSLQGHITTNAVGGDDTRLRRPWYLCGPEDELMAALTDQLAHDGWLDAAKERK